MTCKHLKLFQCQQIRGLTVNLRFRDSNFSPDFSLSAKYLLERFYAEGGEKVDMVLAVNQSSLEDFLDITGPIYVENFGEFNSDNFNYLLTYLIESKHSGVIDPKLVLKQLVPEFKKKILDDMMFERLIPVVYKEMLYQNILAFSEQSDVQNLIRFAGIDGEIAIDKNEDFLTVSNVSVGGTKTDYLVKEDIYHRTEITKNGEVIDMLNITRKHNWDGQLLNVWKTELAKFGITEFEDYVFDIMGRGRNRNIVNIYLPKDIQVISANKEYISFYDEDLGLDVVSTIIEVWPGEEDNFYLKYQLPFELKENGVVEYKMQVKKQPGSYGSSFNKTIHSESLEHVLSFPKENSSKRKDELNYSSTLSFDLLFKSIWE